MRSIGVLDLFQHRCRLGIFADVVQHGYFRVAFHVGLAGQDEDLQRLLSRNARYGKKRDSERGDNSS